MINDFLIKYFGIEIIKTFPREAIKFAKNYFKNKELIVAEIGVYFGRNARSINNELNIKELYLIDEYRDYADGKSQKELDKAKKSAHKMNKNSNIRWIEKMSYDIISEVPDLDFLYVDGSHTYEGVKKI